MIDVLSIMHEITSRMNIHIWQIVYFEVGCVVGERSDYPSRPAHIGNWGIMRHWPLEVHVVFVCFLLERGHMIGAWWIRDGYVVTEKDRSGSTEECPCDRFQKSPVSLVHAKTGRAAFCTLKRSLLLRLLKTSSGKVDGSEELSAQEEDGAMRWKRLEA